MARIAHLVKHRTVIDRKDRQDISQEPEMHELKGLLSKMTPEEKDRTEKYLSERDKAENDHEEG